MTSMDVAMPAMVRDRLPALAPVANRLHAARVAASAAPLKGSGLSIFMVLLRV